ncbi:hypothetical protein AB1Y20_012441 [Prymnesium parvum]|uniref:Uncharacterized protein n=1 Tax=Prymnesium parvum TaxID=97485 RepID=A0AB34IJU4_PRYPA
MANSSLPPRWADFAHSRVATCMVGATRTLLHPAVHQSVKQQLLDSQLAPVDLFLHLHLRWDGTNFAPGMGHHGASGGSLEPNDPKLRRVIDFLQPVEVALHSASDCSEPPLDRHAVCVDLRRSWPSSSPSEADRAGFLQYMWIVECQRSVMRYEKAHGLTYSWLIRTRPDIAFFDRVPPCITMSTRRLVCMEKESNPSYFDGFWMVPRNFLEEFTEAIDTFWTSTWKQRHKLPWPPEWHLFPYLRHQRGMPWVMHPIPAVLVRRRGVLDCWRLARREKQEVVYDIAGSSFGRDANGRLMSFSDACLRFAETHFNYKPAAATPSPSAAHELASDFHSFLKPPDCRNSSWEEVDANVAEPLHGADRCAVRFQSLLSAQAACCAKPKCEAVVHDHGMSCRSHGKAALHEYELRVGAAHVRHLSRKRKSPEGRLGALRRALLGRVGSND